MLVRLRADLLLLTGDSGLSLRSRHSGTTVHRAFTKMLLRVLSYHLNASYTLSGEHRAPLHRHSVTPTPAAAQHQSSFCRDGKAVLHVMSP